MKKKLNEAGITNELRGNSAYFQASPAADVDQVNETKPRKQPAPARKPAPVITPAITEPEIAAEQPATAPTVLSAAQVLPGSITVDAFLPPTQDQLIETIRKAVKRLGKEATFCRFTQEEKSTLSDIIYTYKRSGTRTSENEVIRIAVNWLLENYQNDGRNSILAQVLEKLNA
ncbi:hypothetical protein BH10CHL1_BH10CHL1_14640 [soil metagenome]